LRDWKIFVINRRSNYISHFVDMLKINYHNIFWCSNICIQLYNAAIKFILSYLYNLIVNSIAPVASNFCMTIWYLWNKRFSSFNHSLFREQIDDLKYCWNIARRCHYLLYPIEGEGANTHINIIIPILSALL
jgi:hypothetical protein